jgi:hypothetical protein
VTRALAGLLPGVFLLSWTGTANASPAYPLEKSSNGRYFVDQAGVPVLVHGATPWSLISNLTREEVTIYLDDCVARKFNSLIVTSPDAVFTANPPNNAYGDPPFTVAGKFSTPNEAYFQHADWVIQEAAARGIQILLAPAYLGHPDEGWFEQVRDHNTEQEMREYGAWVGNRYKNTPNLMFHWGGEPLPLDSVRDKIRAMAEGRRSVDSSHLTTYHSSSAQATYDVWNVTQESWLDFNTIYSYAPIWQSAERDYAFSPVTPFILFETTYEHNGGATALQMRTQAYHALLSGACGHFYGNEDIWSFGNDFGFGSGSTDWVAAMSDPGRLDMLHVRNLFESRAWYRLVPDFADTVLTAGHSSAGDRATAAFTDDGATLIVYAPSQRPLRINLDALSGSDATAWWFNPRDGSVDSGTPLVSSGGRDLIPPTNDDWVLVIDDAASMLPPPGTGAIVPDRDVNDAGSAGGQPSPKPALAAPSCNSSSVEKSSWTLWYLVVLGAWVLLERRRGRRGA